MKSLLVFCFLFGVVLSHGLCGTNEAARIGMEKLNAISFGRVFECRGESVEVKTTDYIVVNDLPLWGTEEHVYNPVKVFDFPFQIVYVTDIYPPGTVIEVRPCNDRRWQYEYKNGQRCEIPRPYVFPLKLEPDWFVWVPEGLCGAVAQRFAVLSKEEMKKYWFVGLGSQDWRFLHTVLELLYVVKENPSLCNGKSTQLFERTAAFLRLLQRKSIEAYEGMDYHFAAHASCVKTRCELVDMYPIVPKQEKWCPRDWRTIAAFVNCYRTLLLYEGEEAEQLQAFFGEYLKELQKALDRGESTRL